MTSSPSSGNRYPGLKVPGVLRLALFPSFFYRKDPATGELRGVGIEIGRALARAMEATLLPSEYLSPPKVVEALGAGQADVAMLGIDPVRGSEVDFSPPIFSAEFTFLVPEDSNLRDIAGADRPGLRIALVRHHAMDTALRGSLAQAERVYADTPDAAFELFRAGSADVLAGIRPGLLMYARTMPGTRVLDDRYGRNVIALAVRKGDAEFLSRVRAFVERAKADGTVARAIERAGLGGVDVA